MLVYKQLHHFSTFSMKILETYNHIGLLLSTDDFFFFFYGFSECLVPCRRVGPVRAHLAVLETGLHCLFSTHCVIVL